MPYEQRSASWSGNVSADPGAISGRTPLYKLEQSFVQQDMELLFGRDIPPSKFNDDLVGRTMRRSLQDRGGVVEGWDKKPTSRPTSLMIVMIFLSMVVIRMPEKRLLANGMSPRQRVYLDILGVSPREFIDPHVQYGADLSQESKSWETTG